jgi:hypothetical protein
MLKTMVSQWKYILVSNAEASRFFLQGQCGITLDNTKYKIKHENLVVSPLKANATTHSLGEGKLAAEPDCQKR